MALIFRKGTLEDADLFVHFLHEIKKQMEQKEWLYLDPPEMVHAMMADGIMDLWLVMDDDQLAAVFSVLYPGMEPYNYGYDLRFSKEELLQVVHMDTAAVHPKYRGLGLQGQMVRVAENALAGQERKILICTVHPENLFSLNNMLRQGYEIQKRIGKYGSERFILQKILFEEN